MTQHSTLQDKTIPPSVGVSPATDTLATRANSPRKSVVVGERIPPFVHPHSKAVPAHGGNTWASFGQVKSSDEKVMS